MEIVINGDFTIEFGNGTDVGKIREINEDYHESFESEFGYVFIVCDGMGGHAAGEVASRLAVFAVKEYIINNPEAITSTKQIIVSAIEEANRRIIEKCSDEPDYRGMGTTIVVLIIKAGIAYYGHVGDSRIYLVRCSKIFQMTKDHSFVQTLIDGGLISYEEAENHPRKNEITQALGISKNIKVDVCKDGLDIYKNDIFVLCTDGLSGMVSDEDIKETVLHYDADSVSHTLINMANSSGGTDNITMQVIKVSDGTLIPRSRINTPPKGSLNKSNTFLVSEAMPEFQRGLSSGKRVMVYLIMILLIGVFSGLTLYILQKHNNVVVLSEKDKKKIKNDAKDEIKKFFENIYLKDTSSAYESQHFVINKIIIRDADNVYNEDLYYLKKYLDDRKYSNYFKWLNDTASINIFNFLVRMKGGYVSVILKGEIKNNQFYANEIEFINNPASMDKFLQNDYEMKKRKESEHKKPGDKEKEEKNIKKNNDENNKENDVKKKESDAGNDKSEKENKQSDEKSDKDIKNTENN